MSYRIAVCDDDPASVTYIHDLARRWAAARETAVSLESFPSAESFLFQFTAHNDYDILLLDIEMGNMNGIELARAVRTKNKEIPIIFITGYSDYLPDGYEVEALHYLLKPVNVEKLFSVLDRAADKLKRNERFLVLPLHDGVVRLSFNDIRYLEVQKNYVTVHAAEAYTVKKPLSELEQELDDSFVRTGRSFLVNLRYIRKISRHDLTLKDGSVLPLSRGLYDSVNQAMIRHF